MTYQDAQTRSLELNKQLKGSSHFARPKKDPEKKDIWDVEIVDSVNLLKQHEAGKVHFDDKGY